MAKRAAQLINVNSHTNITTTYSVPLEVVKKILLDGLKARGIIADNLNLQSSELTANCTDGYEEYNLLNVNELLITVHSVWQTEHKLLEPNKGE